MSFTNHDFDDAEKELASSLMDVVRDQSIQLMDQYLAGTMGEVTQQRFDRLIRVGDVEAQLIAFLPEVVDSVLSNLGALLDSELLPLYWKLESGEYLPVCKFADGSMAGHMLDDSPESWRSIYSKERAHPLEPSLDET